MITLSQLDNYINKIVVYKSENGQLCEGRIISYSVNHIGAIKLTDGVDLGEVSPTKTTIKLVVKSTNEYNSYVTISYEQIL